MHPSILTLIAIVAFAFTVTMNCDQCAGQQSLRRPDARQLELLESAQTLTPNRLGNHLLSDLRSQQFNMNEGERPAENLQTPLQYEPTILTSDSQSKLLQTVPNQSSTRREQSFFNDSQTPPVVVVYLNSNLQKSLLSEGKFKQLIQSIPKRDRRTQQPDGNAWQTSSQSQIRSVSFEEAVSEESSEDGAEEEQIRELPLGVVTVEGQIKDFRTRLNKIGIHFDLKTKQLTADESTDSATKSEMNNLLSVASDWIERAKSGLKEFEEQNNAKNKFKTELPLREKELADEKKLAATNLKTDWSFVPSSNSEAIAILQKKLQEQETWLQQSMNKRSEVRKQILARDQRVTDLPSLRRKNAEVEEKTRGLMAELDNQPDDLNRSLQRLHLDAKFLSLEITEKSLELESLRKEQTGQILPLELEELTLRIRRLKLRVAETRSRSDKLRDQQLDDRRLAARNDLKLILTQSTPQLKELAEFNMELVVEKKELAVKSDELEKELINVRQLQAELSESQTRIEAQIETLGPTASGIHLVEHRRSLISTGKSQNRLLEIADRLQYKQARKLMVSERLEALVLGDEFKKNVLAKVEEQVEDHLQQQKAVDVANHLLKTEKEYATDLLTMFKDNIQKLSQLETAHKALIDEVRKAKAFSDQNSLWVRSAKPIQINDFNRCRTGLQSIITSKEWRGISSHAYETFQKRPYDVGLLAFVIGSLLVVRRRLRWSHE